MRFVSFALILVALFFVPHAADAQGKKKGVKDAGFKPVEISGAIDENDAKDPKIDQPSKKYTVKLTKDKTYIIDMISKDFDSYLRLLDKAGNQLEEDDDSGGDLNSRIIYTAKETADHEVVAITLDGQVGKFTVKVREFVLKGEAKARDVGDGINVNDKIANGDKTAIDKLGKVYSVNLKAGQTYTIDLASPTMDSYLYLFDSKGKKLAEDDDSGGNLDSRIVFRAQTDGVYHVIATSLNGNETGDFTLNVRKND